MHKMNNNNSQPALRHFRIFHDFYNFHNFRNHFSKSTSRILLCAVPLIGLVGQQIACTTTNAAAQNGQNGQNLPNQNGQETVGPVVDPIDMASVDLKTLIDLDDVENIRLPAVSQHLPPQLFAVSKDIAQQNQQFSIGTNPSDYKNAHTCITLYTLAARTTLRKHVDNGYKIFIKATRPKRHKCEDSEKQRGWALASLF